MDLAPYIEQLRRELAIAAEAGGEDVRALAERLTASLESATRLVLLDALSAAAGEITRDLAPGSVDVRLRGRDPDFLVTPPPGDEFDDTGVRPTGFPGSGRDVRPSAPSTSSAPPEAEEGGTSRITLRLPEHLKPRVEEAAGREGVSVNTWLVRAVVGALDSDGRDGRTERPRNSRLGRHHTGWVR